jgi:hypothetical protein
MLAFEDQMSAPSATRSSPVVFLSYSSADHEWKEGLKRALSPLSERGFVSIWDDRKIPAGTAWEPELEQYLNRARIILLLLTEDYFSSPWCRRERDEALKLRDGDPTKLVIPVFVKRVSLPAGDPLLALQGLPRGTDGTRGQNGLKWADEWGREEQNKPRSLIVEGMLELLHPLATNGPTRGAPSQISPKMSLPPWFVDRETQERQFRDFWDLASWSRPGAAQIYVLPAMEVDLPGFFLGRLREGVVQRLANVLKGSDRASIPEPKTVPEPRYGTLDQMRVDMARDLFEQCDAAWKPVPTSELSAKPLATLDHFRLYSFVLIQQTLRADRVGSQLGPLLSWYVNVFWAGFASEVQILVFLNLLYPPSEQARKSRGWRFFVPSRAAGLASPESELRARLEEFLPEGRANLVEGHADVGAPVKLLPPLPPIEASDIKKWLERLDMLPTEAQAEAERIVDASLSLGGNRLSYCYRPLQDYYTKLTTGRR